MITLSRLMLDPYSRIVQKELSDSYQMHRTLCHAFPGLSPEEWRAARVLFRVDDDNERLSLLVQSHIAPDWDAFVMHLGDKRYLLDAPQRTAWKSVEEQKAEGVFRLQEGQRLRFRLQGNPTYAPIIAGAVNKKGRFKSKTRGLYREAERLDWLRRQGEQYGFTLDYERDEKGEPRPICLKSREVIRDGKSENVPVVFRGCQYEKFEIVLPLCQAVDLNDGKRFALPAQKNQFSAARFDGTLAVADAETFALAVENGIGKARGFGFGLLSVAPVAK